MKPFIEYENDNLPLSKVPYAFKSRLMQLASINDATKMKMAFPNTTICRYRQHESHTGAFITDDQHIFSLALKHAWWYSPWRWHKYYLDGRYTFYPTWRSALHVDNIAKNKELLCVNDTLVLFLTAEDSYDLIIPKIAGSYSRLVLHGFNYTWPQVKRLIHKKVKQVRIMNSVEVDPDEYDFVVDFILRFSRGFMNKFVVRGGCFPSKLMDKLNEAFKHHGTHSMITRTNDIYKYFNHKLYSFFYFFFWIVVYHIAWFLIILLLCFNTGCQNQQELKTGDHVCFCIIGNLVILIPLTIIIKSFLSFWQPDIAVRHAFYAN